ncbi:MAG: hypothetical protein LQ350_004341 [Teloschistes chrysophthalmus]|nr:MAG: hypothetical protein LQ350_004341 [Niorma chrysophthalma]
METDKTAHQDKKASDYTEYIAQIESNGSSQATEKALVRKIDLFLLPTIWLMYLLSYVDRTNIGNAKIAGMQADLHLSSGQYSVSLIVFFISYVLFEIPSNLILSKSRPSIFLPTIMILWGIVTCCMAAVKSYRQLVALRFVVGVLEAGFAPGVLLILSSWYKREEQSKRFAVYISAAILSGAFGGLLAGAITKNLEGAHGIRGWRWLFIVEGAASIGWACIARFLLLDFPLTSKYLSEDERRFAADRLLVTDRSRASDEHRLGPLQAIKRSLTNWRVWLFTAGYMVIVGSSTLSYFYPTLVNGLGYEANKAQYMTVPIYAVAFVCNAFTGYFSDRVPRRRGMIISCWLSISLACSIATAIATNFTARYVLLVLMAAGLWSTNALSLSFASSTFASMSREARAVSLAFVNAMGNLAQIYGAYLFPSGDAPRYIMGFSVVSAMCAFGVGVYGVLYLVAKRGSLD